jgi:hypothetical protein
MGRRDRDIFSIKQSFIVLAITAGLQQVFVSSGMAMLADIIQSIRDATTPVPLRVAIPQNFTLANALTLAPGISTSSD